MGGYASSFSYDEDRYITGIDGTRGRWQFRTEPADGIAKWSDAYPPPGEPMWANYRITVTDPLGDSYEYFYYGGCEPEYGCGGYSWYVSPRDYIPWRSLAVNTYNAQAPRTRYLPVVTDGGKGEIAEIHTPAGRKWRYSFDPDGNISEMSDGAGNVTLYAHGSRGQLLSRTDPNGATTEYTYAPNGLDVIGVTDGRGRPRSRTTRRAM